MQSGSARRVSPRSAECWTWISNNSLIGLKREIDALHVHLVTVEVGIVRTRAAKVENRAGNSCSVTYTERFRRKAARDGNQT
jgi:hypothetical protein